MKTALPLCIAGGFICGLSVSAATYDIQILPGWTPIANHFECRRLSQLIPNPQDGEAVAKLNPGMGYQTFTYIDGLGWDPSDPLLCSGEGALYYSLHTFTLTISGTAQPPVLPRSLQPGEFYLISAQTPAPATYEDIVGLPPTTGTLLERLIPGAPSSAMTCSQCFQAYTNTGSGWQPAAPVVRAGESVFIQVAAAAPALPDKDADVDVAVPQRAATKQKPMIWEIHEKDPNDATKLVKREVKVDNLPEFRFVHPAFMRPAPLPNETPLAYQIRTAALYEQYLKDRQAAFKMQWEAASKDKAEKCADAINNQIGANRATAAQFNNPNGFKQGRVTIVNAHKIVQGKNSNSTGEDGDGVKIKNGAGGGGAYPYPYRGSMGSAGRSQSSAQGVDPSGGPSVVTVGISNRYVASWYPAPGESDQDVLLGLKALLDMNGLAASYDSAQRVLTLDGNFGDSDTFVWAMTDMGFDEMLGVSYGSTAPVATFSNSFDNFADNFCDAFETGAAFKIAFVGDIRTNVVVTGLRDTNTVVGRSASFWEGDAADQDGVTINCRDGFPDTAAKVSDETCRIPKGFPEGPATRREVHTEILALLLRNTNGSMFAVQVGDSTTNFVMPAGAVTIRAAQPFSDSVSNSPARSFYRNSIGEVASLYAGNPTNLDMDFPARSFFNVYVEVDIQLPGLARKLYNKSPLVLSSEITRFPPDLTLPNSTYIHDPAFGAVALYDANNTLAAYLLSAGHGAATNVSQLSPDAPQQMTCPVSFTLNGLCHTNGAAPAVTPNDAAADRGSAARSLSVYLSSGRVTGAVPDQSNRRQLGSATGFDAADAIHSISFGRDGTANPFDPRCPISNSTPGTIYFSVSCTSTGLPCSDVWRQATAASPEAAADIFASAAPPFGKYGKPPGLEAVNGDNWLAVEEQQLGLAPGENLTGLELGVFNGNTNDAAHDCLYVTMTGPSYVNDGATIYLYDPAGGPFGRGALSPFAAANTLGLQTNDVIDALVLSDINPRRLCPPTPNRRLDPGGPGTNQFDEVLFSLAPGSPTLMNNALNVPLSPADVLYSRFDGAFSIFVRYAALGLTFFDDVDAIDIKPGMPLSVSCAPALADQTAVVGHRATFVAVPYGVPPFFYQWKSNNVLIPDATNATLTPPPTALADEGTVYTIGISNAFSFTNCSATLHVTPSAIDTDGDGMPDDWEDSHGLNRFIAGDGNLDSDGDGMSNRQEYLAGTDPQNPDSKLELGADISSGASVQLQFIAQQDRTYAVQYKTNLDAVSWSVLTTIPSGPQRPVQVSDALTTLRRFYRLSAAPE